MIEVFTQICLLIGTVFMLLAALGLVRLPDVYMRLQAVSKAVTMGVGWIMLAVALSFETPWGLLRAAAIFSFVYVTAPVAAHLLGRAAYLTNAPLWEGTVVDEMSAHGRSGRKQDGAEKTALSR
ncbi:monovalent cation/H(+) antiporter subunit G [Candidatus Nitrospira bockiana]